MREPTQLERNEAAYFEGLDVDSLYVVIGRACQGNAGVQFSPDRASKEGKSWFKARYDTLYSKICVEWEYCMKRNDDSLRDPISLAVSIGDLIIAATWKWGSDQAKYLIRRLNHIKKTSFLGLEGPF